MKRALVTGGTGFVGSALARRLVGDSVEVVLLVRDSSSLAALGDAADAVDVVRIDGERGSDAAAAVERAFATSPEVVFSLATSRSRAALADIADMADVLVRLPALLIAGAVDRNVPLITTASYMHAPGDTAPSSYSALRAAVDPIIDWASHHAGLAVTTLSLTSVYGPGDVRTKLLPVLLHAAREGIPIELVEPGRVLDLVHVEDVVDAYLCAAQLSRADDFQSGQRYDVSSGRRTTLAALVEIVERQLGPIAVRWGTRAVTPSDRIDPPTHPRWLAGWEPRRDLAAELPLLV